MIGSVAVALGRVSQVPPWHTESVRLAVAVLHMLAVAVLHVVEACGWAHPPTASKANVTGARIVRTSVSFRSYGGQVLISPVSAAGLAGREGFSGAAEIDRLRLFTGRSLHAGHGWLILTSENRPFYHAER